MDNTTGKMLQRDVWIIVGFGVFLWVTMGFLMFSILTAAGPSHAKGIIIAIGVAVLLFATLSLLVLIFHLRRHSETIYAEELNPTAPEELTGEAVAVELSPVREASSRPDHGIFVKVFDIVFIMVLCFVTLLATMLLRGKTVNGAAIYTVGFASSLVIVVGFTVYFVYILRHSHRELKMMVDEMYSEEGNGD